MNFIDFRLKLRRFFRTYKRLILVIIIIWAIIFFINIILKNMPNDYTPTTTYKSHTAIINSSTSTPKSLQQPIEEYIEEYMGYCNEGNFQKAFNMLSEDCRKYEFDNDINEFMKHIFLKMPNQKKYAIQNYSNIEHGNVSLYIYEIKYIDDILATGLTNSQYSYTTENITFYRENNELKMSVGNYIYHTDIKSISENDYLKIDVIDKVVNYSIEKYKLKFTNKSDYTIVVADAQEKDEILLTLPQETRRYSELVDVVLNPQESLVLELTFPKFVDDGDDSQTLTFSSIRVMEKYSGTEDVDIATIQSEIDNAISKFSMEINVTE